VENITHSLVGAILSRAGLNRFSPHGTLLMVLASNAPDLDVVTAAFGANTYLDYHRGPTHSLLLAPLWAFVPVALLHWGFQRKLPLLRSWLLCLLAVVIHIGMDFLTGYGTKPFWPFASAWIQWPVLYISDIYILLACLIALAAPALSGLVSGEIGAKKGTGRGWAIAALVFALTWIGFRGLMRDRVQDMLASHVYQGRSPKRYTALPTPFNPLRWRGLVECEGFLSEHNVQVFEEFDPDNGTLLLQPRQAEILAAARKAPEMKRFLDFAQWPSFRVIPMEAPPGAVRVEVRDLRFATGFEATVELDRTGQVIEESSTAGGSLRDNSKRP
jgi:inner membrane protein